MPWYQLYLERGSGMLPLSGRAAVTPGPSCSDVLTYGFFMPHASASSPGMTSSTSISGAPRPASGLMP